MIPVSGDHRMKRIALAAVLLVALVGPAAAGFDEGAAALERGDYATALKEFRPLAEQGHAAAQNSLGVMYEYGDGVPKDYAEAIKWYRIAAEQSYVAAQNNLGVMYQYGMGVQQDYVEAVKWFRRAADQGLATAQRNLSGKPRIGCDDVGCASLTLWIV